MRLIGDVPIYVAPGSADHRAHPELFRADAVAGTPPDAYTDKGQLWGNPLYDWPALQRRRYRWWTDPAASRIRSMNVRQWALACHAVKLPPPLRACSSIPPRSPGGRLGPEARAFVDWLAAAGQSWWQMLPLGPPDQLRLAVQGAHRRSPPGRGCSQTPRAPVSKADGARLPRARGVLDRGLGRVRRGAVADQVRFDREWAALRSLRRASAACG